MKRIKIEINGTVFFEGNVLSLVALSLLAISCFKLGEWLAGKVISLF